MKYKPLGCLAFGPDWKKFSIVFLDILMLIFQPFKVSGRSGPKSIWPKSIRP